MLIDGHTVIRESTLESVRKPVVDVIVIRNPAWQWRPRLGRVGDAERVVKSGVLR